MKLNIPRPEIETSEQFQSNSFEIGDLALVFDILRNKMYSNPIQAICREISSNSRDAHREVNKFSTPCQIILPSALQPFITFKDFGPGLSPQRVKDVFLKKGISTKRNDNIQGGGYGIGSISAHAYADTFTVVTVHNHIKYHYSCFIDESRIGQLSLLHQEITDEQNGTEIIIPVKPQDFHSFIQGVEYVTRHWDPRPIVTGSSSFKYEDVSPVLQGTDWLITKGYSELRLIIDGIEYPLDQTVFRNNMKLLTSIIGITYLKFGVGELSLQASREQVHLDKSTKEKIIAKIATVEKEIKSKIIESINAQPSFWDANYYFNNDLYNIIYDPSRFGQLHWTNNGKSIPLISKCFRLKNVSIYLFKKGLYSKNQNFPDRLSRSTTHDIYFNKNTKIYYNDLILKEINKKQVSQAFENDPSLKYVYVIDGSPGAIQQSLLDHFQHIEINKLSDIAKQPKSYTTSGSRLLLFTFDLSLRSFKQVSQESYKGETRKIVYCKLHRSQDGTRTISLSNKTLNNKVISYLSKDVQIYGVDESVYDKAKKIFKNAIAIEDYLPQALSNNVDYYLIKHAKEINLLFDSKNNKFYNDFKNKLSNNSDYLKYLELQMLLKDCLKNLELLEIYEMINEPIALDKLQDYIAKHPEYDLEKQSEVVKNKYPLIQYLDRYYDDRVLEPTINYINLIDQKESK